VVSHLLNKFYHIAQQAVFPSKCLVCNAFYQIPERNRYRISAINIAGERARPFSIRAQAQKSLANCLCPGCLTDLILVESPLCTGCGIPFAGRQGADHYCGACLASGNRSGIARAPLVYDKFMSEVIHSFKYRGKIQLAEPLSELLLTAFMFFWDIDAIDIILPVPLHPSRLRQRGFNQAYLLIGNWPRLAVRHAGDLSRIQIERELLIRTTPTVPQSALGRDQRAENIKGAFDLAHKETVQEKNILLIDDVYTTGATVNECGRLLLKCGARKVDVLTLARAV
jgi:ComF family protein